MIKKMWALFFENDSCVAGNVDKDRLISDVVIHEKQIKHIKPVWVSDRDPHENIRYLKNNCNELTGISLNNAVEKDLKNIEETG